MYIIHSEVANNCQCGVKLLNRDTTPKKFHIDLCFLAFWNNMSVYTMEDYSKSIPITKHTFCNNITYLNESILLKLQNWNTRSILFSKMV